MLQAFKEEPSFMSQYPMLTHFVSEIDLVLQQFDKTHPPSLSQQKEQAKYAHIYKLRDMACPYEKTIVSWENF